MSFVVCITPSSVLCAHAGTTYEGQWSVGRKQGKGRMQWKNGDSYEGEYVGDHMEGIAPFSSMEREKEIERERKR